MGQQWGRIHFLIVFKKCIRSFLILEILTQADAGNAPEGAGEVRGIGITQQVGNLGDAFIRVFKKIGCCFKPRLVEQAPVGQAPISQPALQCSHAEARVFRRNILCKHSSPE